MRRPFLIMLLLAIILTGCQERENVKSFGTGAFSFTYELDGTFERGETVGVEILVTNQQEESYKWVGSSTVSARTYVVCRENGFTMQSTLSVGNADYGPQELAPGETKGGSHGFRIPDYAPAGNYCLVCHYGDEDTFSETSFMNIFTLDGKKVGKSGQAATFGTGAFGFSYEAAGSTLERGESFTVDIDVTNLQSETYTWHGAYYLEIDALLVCRENGFIIRPEVWGPEYEPQSLASGESRVTTCTFHIPDYAPAGDYCLVCQYGFMEDFSETSFVDVFTLPD